MSHNRKYYLKKLERNAAMSRNIAFMLQKKVLSNAVLNNNQALDNNPTSVVETNSSEKEITNAEEQQESSSNDSQSETAQILENLNSTENVSEPDSDISISIDTAKELPLSQLQSSTNPDVKKSNESKLVSCEMRFPDFYFSSVKNGWLCKICCSFSHGNAGNRAFVGKPGKLGEIPSARFSDHLNSNRHKLSMKKTAMLKITFLMIRKNWAHSHNFRDLVELAADCGAIEISSHLLTATKNSKYFHHCMSQSTLKLCLII